jgi:glycosyltransferase involved in cell wall biosynthesis
MMALAQPLHCLQKSTRLAVVVSHPIQYYAPWFRMLSLEPGLELMVFHLWDFGVVPRPDRGFGQTVVWDIPLLEGYPHSFVANLAADPGTHHFAGLHNPSLVMELLSWRPDAILLFGYAYHSHLSLMLDCRLWRVPILFRGDSHGLCSRPGWRPFLTSALRSILFRRFAAALAVGQANAAWLRASGVPQRRIVIAPHAVDNQRFQDAAPAASMEAHQWRKQLGIPSQVPVVLFAGKFETKKRPLQLLEAFAALSHLQAVLVLAGAGALEQDIRRRAAALPSGRVVVLPFQNQSAMPRLYALADLVVLPSFGPGETWGLCINEAMNMARPVLVSSHVGCGPDLVIPGETGWIVPAGDQDALRVQLAEALADRRRLQAMGEQARAHVATHSYAATTAGLQQALAQVVDQR